MREFAKTTRAALTDDGIQIIVPESKLVLKTLPKLDCIVDEKTAMSYVAGRNDEKLDNADLTREQIVTALKSHNKALKKRLAEEKAAKKAALIEARKSGVVTRTVGRLPGYANGQPTPVPEAANPTAGIHAIPTPSLDSGRTGVEVLIPQPGTA